MFHNCLRLGAACNSIVLLCLLSACASTPGTKALVDRSALTALQRIGVTVTQEEDFSVLWGRDQFAGAPNFGGSAGGGLLGLIVLAAAIGGTSSADAEYTRQIKPALGAYDAAKLFTTGLVRNLQHEPRFITVVNVAADEKSAAKGRGLDGIAEITLKRWGLRLCGAADTEVKVQAGFYIEGRIVSVAKGETVWERHEFHLDSECRTLDELSSQKGLLVNLLSRVIDYLSGKMANEIRFP